MLVKCLCLFALLGFVSADMYLQNMRGSNNRLDEANRDRDNANRLFDSQNNNRGGYNVGSLYFYEGEKIPFEWTNQHGCGNEWNKCEIILQYMCSPNLRDGTTTNTIPEQPSNCANNDCNRDIRFGMHEDYDYYMNCKYRYRNFGLFTADQNLNGRTARFTRQNPNGNRRGYECPEERDHFPYWGPTPWVDLAVLTNDPGRCDFYRAESENIKGRYYCSLPDKWYHFMVSQGGNGNNGFIPSTASQCQALNAPSSQMMIYLRAQAMQFASTLQTQIADELSYCNSEISAGATIKTVTLAQLEAACPSCPTGFVTHPYAFCKVCIPSACLASVVAVNSSNVTGCPAGSIVDTANNPGYCISAACSQVYSTYAQLVAVDNCRSSFIAANGSLVDSNGLCIARTAMTADCQSLALTPANWTQADAHNASLPFLSPSGPLCIQNPWSRPNHLGNGYGGFTNGFNFTFPSYYQETCAMRIRYNITTADYNGLDPQNSGQVNSSLNRPNGDNAARVDIRARYGLPTSDSANPYRNARGYLFKNNPTVQIFDYYQNRRYCSALTRVVPNDPTRCYTDDNVNATNRGKTTAFSGFCPRTYPYLYPPAGAQGTVACSKETTGVTTTTMKTTDDDFTLRLAINTAQFGRTFQDRSHKFAMRQRPPVLSAECGDIYSLNVRGKRGNIVQTYPGTEYDFTPNRLHLAVGDCIHPQWTGSNTNPNNNDGQGKEGTDRHNIAQQICIRGQGGLGVAGPGGRGRRGTTWTTANMEPGWQGWVQDAAPTMADMQCPPASSPYHTEVHPYNWHICIQPAPTCTFTTRPYTATATSRVYGACPTGSAPDTQNPTVCLTSVCTLVTRPANPTSWVSGLDPLDPSALGFNASQIGTPNALKHGCWGMSFPEHLDNSTFLGLTRLDLQHLAILDNMQFGGNMKQLDDAGTYFDLGVRRVAAMGTYTYMCTRNNNFSNRSQKGKVQVSATPQNRVLVTSTGGSVAVNTQQSFRPTTQTNSTTDYLLTIPANCLTSATDVTLATMQAPGSLSAASDFVLIAPSTLSCHIQMPPVTLAPISPTRSIALAGAVIAKVTIVNSSAIHFTISSSGFQEFYTQWQAARAAGTYNTAPWVTVQFLTGDNSAAASPVLTESFTNTYTLDDVWANLDSAQMQAFEKGQMWVSVNVDGAVYRGQASVDPTSLQSITVTLPVSVTMQYGSVFYYPDTALGALCATGNADATACASIRTQVQGAQIANGVATFQVGASTTSPAGGYYYVSPGSNLAIIIGVTIACVVCALAAVGSAVYFRKHPDKWTSVKAWGPRRYKAISRSCSSQV